MKQLTFGRVALALVSTGALCLTLAPVASASGGNSANAKLCQQGWQNLFAASTGLAFTNPGVCVASGTHGGYSSLTVSTTVIANCGTVGCWGQTSGFGLQPGSTVSLTYNIFGGTANIPNNGTVQPDGTVTGERVLGCGAGITNAFSTGTTSAGATITSPAVNSPCG